MVLERFLKSNLKSLLHFRNTLQLVPNKIELINLFCWDQVRQEKEDIRIFLLKMYFFSTFKRIGYFFLRERDLYIDTNSHDKDSTLLFLPKTSELFYPQL